MDWTENEGPLDELKHLFSKDVHWSGPSMGWVALSRVGAVIFT